MTDTAIKIQNLKKKYRLGVIGGTTLNAELQSWWARKRGKDDPNMKIGEDIGHFNKTFLALDGINLEIKKGEALGIIGANGAGKSTLLKILSRVTAPTEGDIWINGRISSMLEVGTGFHGELTGRENIFMNGAILGMSKKEVERKIFPSYVLVKMVMNDDTWYVVRNIRGCTGFVGPESKPVPLTDEEVKKLGVEKVSVEVAYAEGDIVNVIDGPLEGFSGTVDSVDVSKNSVQVTISMFGRETAVEFELDQLEKVND